METSHSLTAAVRTHLCEWYTASRARSSALFDLVSDEAYYARPIDLRHPLVFYEGHLATSPSDLTRSRCAWRRATTAGGALPHLDLTTIGQ